MQSRIPTSSPFVVGRPLQSNDPVFGREEAFRALARDLQQASSINIIGERRMGKMSFLNHIVGGQSKYLSAQPGEPPLVLGCVDLQSGVNHPHRFYGMALRAILVALPRDGSAEAAALTQLFRRLEKTPEVHEDEFATVLQWLHERPTVRVRPVIIVDEFERWIEPSLQDAFSPDFFTGLRAFITANTLAMIVASRRPLPDYFKDLTRPGSMTSPFPTYFVLLTLNVLDDAAADALLLQPNDHQLTVREAADARRWAKGHPCHLQAAGKAWYEAKVEGHPTT